MRREYAQLLAVTGDFRIEDESKFHVILLREEPGLLEWRVYIPKGMALCHCYSLVGAFGESRSRQPAKDAREFTVRWQFRTDEARDGFVGLTKIGESTSGSSVSTGGGENYKFLRSHWEQFDFEIAGRNGLELSNASDTLNLLEVRIPDKLDLPEQSFIGRKMFIRLGDGQSDAWQQMVATEKTTRQRHFETASNAAISD